MTEKGKKPGAESDPLSATGMFLNAFRTQPEEPAEQPLEGSAKGPAKPEPPGEFTQMFHKLEPPPPLPQARSTNTPQRDTGEFTRMFVAAATSHDLRPVPATPDPAPFAPPPTPKLRGFSAPGISDSASPEGSFTQLFRTPPSTAVPPPVQAFTPLPITTPQAAEPEWPQSLDPAPNGDRTAQGGLTQLFRSLSEEDEPPPNRFGEGSLGGHSASPVQPPISNPESVTMLIQRLTEDLQQAVASGPATPPAAAPTDSSQAGEFTRIIAGGVTKPASAAETGTAAPGAAAGNFAMPVPPTLVFPAAPVPALAAPQVPVPPAPAFAPPAPAFAVPPAQPAKVASSAPPQQSKLQQLLPMLLVLNAFLLVVLILLVVFVLRSR
jgi:hypothetical protein